MELPTVAKKFAEAGVPRSVRTLQRYCEKGHLEAKKYDVELGETWFVNPESVHTRIAEIKQHAAIASNDDTPPSRQLHDGVTGVNVRRENETETSTSNNVGRRHETDDTGWRPEKTRERQTASDADIKTVTLPVAVLDALTQQLTTKDEQIKAKDHQLKEAAQMMKEERKGHQANLLLLSKAMEVISDGRFELPVEAANPKPDPVDPPDVLSATENRPFEEAAAEWKAEQEGLKV